MRVKRNVLIVSGQHFATQPRWVDLHFIADALKSRGDHADFLSVRLSFVSRLAKDPRWLFASTRPHNKWVSVDPLQDEYIMLTIVHAVNLKVPFLNRISALHRWRGGTVPRPVRQRLASYTDILIESGMALLLLPELRRLAPQARIIYHAADRLETIGAHPLAREILFARSRDIDLVHVMAEAIRDDIPPGIPIVYLPHGLNKEALGGAGTSPYLAPKNAVCVGDMLFDANAVEIMATANPDWTIHLFGSKAALPKPMPNVVAHGEQPFNAIAPYLTFADLGIAPYRLASDVDYLSQSSMKMIQYTYCRLPIVAPAFAAAGRNHVFGYCPADQDSIEAAFRQGATHERRLIDVSTISTWEEKVDRLFP